MKIKIDEFKLLVDRYYCPLLLSLNHQREKEEKFFKKITGIKGKFKEGLLIERGLYFRKDDIESIHKEVISKSNSELMKVAKRCRERCDKLIKIASSISPHNDFSVSIRKYKKAVSEMTPFLNLIIIIEKTLEKRVEEMLKQKKAFNYDNYMALIFPKGQNEQFKERVSLKLVKKGQKSIFAHQQEYKWIGTKYNYELDFSADDFKNRLKFVKDSEIDEMQKEYLQSEIKTQKLIKEFDLDIQLISAVKEFVFLRTHRTETLCKSYSLFRPVFIEISNKNDIDFDDIKYYTIEEIEDLVKLSKKIDVTRRKQMPYWHIIGKLKFKPELKRYSLKERQEVSLIRGTTANKGYAKGRAVVVISYEDSKKVRKGDIMVCVMTFPHFIAAMERAVAFVTDEGGILCHAAIVAREMGKPCIIGTGNATKVLKDGDLVEVDAENGMVRLIK